jgi:hypothetical protein
VEAVFLRELAGFFPICSCHTPPGTPRNTTDFFPNLKPDTRNTNGNHRLPLIYPGFLRKKNSDTDPIHVSENHPDNSINKEKYQDTPNISERFHQLYIHKILD